MDYSSDVRRRFSAPARAGDISPEARNVLEGAAEDRSLAVWIRFQVQFQDRSIERVRFRAYGCPHTLAAADRLAADLEGRSVDELITIDLNTLAQEIDLPRSKHGKLLRLQDALAACHAQVTDDTGG